MSTILKALRRLEEDRRREDERSLRDRILSNEPAGVERSAGGNFPAAVLGGVGALALLVAGAVTWWVLAGSGSQDSAGGFVEETAPVFREDPVAKPVEVASSIGLPAVSAPPPAARSAPPEAASPPAPAPVPVSSPEAVEVAASSPGIAEDIGLITRPPKPGAAAPDSPVARETAPTLSRPRSPEPTPAVQARRSEAPAIQTIERPPMPEFVVTRTVWHPEAGRRVAMIRRSGQDAAQAFGEGENLGVLEIVEIQPAGVLFGGDGVEIKRRVGR
ncbi:MAG: hypothetical protein VX574_02905 [Myxococcota bacterium]|nr:hypothetical protein [Myxococcota bacterium]